MRKYVRAGLEALSNQGAEDAAGVIMSRAGALAEQLSAFASGFLEWSAEARASLLQEVRDMITRQVDSMGLATKDEVETLRRRIDRLEERGPRASGPSVAPGRGPAKKATSRKGASARAGSRSSRKGTSTRQPPTAGKATSTRRPPTARKAAITGKATSTRRPPTARKATTTGKAAPNRKPAGTRSGAARRSTSE